MSNVNPINGVPFGQEKTREDFLARAAWDYDQASRLREAKRPIGYMALVEGHEQAARAYEREAPNKPSARGRSHSTIAGAPARPRRARKTRDIHVVQGNYGYGHGWEDVTAAETRKEALTHLREYRENEPGTPFRLIRRRERVETPVTDTAHARKKKLTPHEAKRLLESEGIDFSRDYYASISMSAGNRIAEVAKMAGYRKSKNAPGSTGRMYFQYLSRLK